MTNKKMKKNQSNTVNTSTMKQISIHEAFAPGAIGLSAAPSTMHNLSEMKKYNNPISNGEGVSVASPGKLGGKSFPAIIIMLLAFWMLSGSKANAQACSSVWTLTSSGVASVNGNV